MELKVSETDWKCYFFLLTARAGMVADFIQPGLVQLQPNLEDFMDTLEPFHGTLTLLFVFVFGLGGSLAKLCMLLIITDFVNTKFLPSVPEELENLDGAQEHLLNVDLPNLIQTRMQQTHFSKPSGNQSIDNHQVNYSSHANHPPTQTPNFYVMNQMSESTNRSSNTTSHSQSSHPSSSVTALLKEDHKQRGRTSAGYPSNSREDIFAVPKVSVSGNYVDLKVQANYSSLSFSAFLDLPWLLRITTPVKIFILSLRVNTQR